MVKRLLLILLSMVVISSFVSCGTKQKKPLNIAVNSWVGYVPFFYMKEVGWLDGKNIEILPVTSLFESVKLMESGAVNAIGGTQQELKHLLHTIKVKPSLFLDRSDGADAVFSNMTVAQIKDSKVAIDVFLEHGSVNELLFDLFVNKFDLNSNTFNLINLDQYSISRKALVKKPTVLITYEPYLTDVQRNGYLKIVDSNDAELYIVDMLIIEEGMENEYSQELTYLREKFFDAVEILEEDPKTFYKLVQGYLDEQSYDEFLLSVATIKWILKDEQDLIMHKMNTLEDGREER